MRIAIVRRARGVSFSMDVYADGIVHGLKAVRPQWDILELSPDATPPYLGKSPIAGAWKYTERYWRFPSRVKRLRADIVHVVDHSDGHFGYWLQAASTPLVVTCHDLINFIQPENISDQARFAPISAAFWRLAVKGICHADRILTVSDHTAKDVMRLLPIEPARVTTIPNAVEPCFQTGSSYEIAAIRQQYKLAPETICLLNVGSNHPRKNMETVLQALRVLKEKGISVHLLKSGASFNAAQQAFIRTHHLSDVITHVGRTPKDTLVKLYNAADVLLTPSLYEGFGMTVLEAMACGTPVIASNVTSLPEVTGDAAVVVKPLDVGAIVQAVCRIRDDPAFRRSLIEKGLARVQSFTWECTAERIAEVYEHLSDDLL
ncbi:MAG: glycosyltransferase family 4 protein [Lyngbya sp. HA4199-MV5]|nr:glycosyltransferase family 4 protein [Lyngbya sp. HA4199-MV5]